MKIYLKKIIFISLFITLFIEISFAKTGKIVLGNGKCVSTDIYNQGRIETCENNNQKQSWEITDDLRIKNINKNQYLTLIQLKSNGWRISLRRKDQQLETNEKIQSQYFKFNEKHKLISTYFSNFCITSNKTYLGVRGLSSCSYKSFWQDFDTPSNFTFVQEINGYELPPKPDETVNNSTLLGIDSNSNGVRDDVERKIIIKYQKPIEIELMMAFAKVDQEVLLSPLTQALYLEKKGSRVINCEMYLLRKGIDIKDSVGDSEDFTYNTKARAKKYIEYNKALKWRSLWR